MFSHGGTFKRTDRWVDAGKHKKKHKKEKKRVKSRGAVRLIDEDDDWRSYAPREVANMDAVTAEQGGMSRRTTAGQPRVPYVTQTLPDVQQRMPRQWSDSLPSPSCPHPTSTVRSWEHGQQVLCILRNDAVACTHRELSRRFQLGRGRCVSGSPAASSRL